MTDESNDEVRQWVKDREAKYPIVIEDGGASGKAFGVSGIPHAFLIDPDGKLVWDGHPASLTEAVIEGALTKAAPLFEALDGPLAPVQELLDQGMDGKALGLLQTLLQGDKLDDKHKRLASFRIRPLERSATRAFAAVDKQIERNRQFEAVVALQDLALRYQGSEQGRQAEARLAVMAKDKDLKREVSASVFLAKAHQLEATQHYDDAWSEYKRALVYGHTKAEETARDAMDAIVRKGLRGFKPDCDDCKLGGKACSKHARR